MREGEGERGEQERKRGGEYERKGERGRGVGVLGKREFKVSIN